VAKSSSPTESQNGEAVNLNGRTTEIGTTDHANALMVLYENLVPK